MEKKISVLLVEDDLVACDDISHAIHTSKQLTLVDVTDNATDAVRCIKDHLPDALVLDLELHTGGGNGLLILQQLQQLCLPARPYVLITTNNTSPLTYEATRQLGADFILSKHQAGYSAKSVIEFLELMHDVIQSYTAAVRSHGTCEAPSEKHRRVLQRICSELNLVGISPKAVGYQYLRDAIDLAMLGKTHNLCSTISRQYAKTEASVERAMQNAINRAWRTTPITELLAYYTAKISSEKGVPTITEFVCYYANKLNYEY